MALPAFSMRQLLEAGVHFGHNTRRWNPKMGPYLFGIRNKIHIIDLQQTVPLLHQAMVAVRAVVAAGGRVLFVGTKRQATNKIADAAKRCGQYYVNHRWLGGMMTNWQTISNSIKRLRDLDEQLAGKSGGLTKKELLGLTRELNKLDRALGGIKEMGGLPDILFVIDTNKEAIAVAESNKLGIPVVAVIDSNSDPEGITYPVPGNDDAIRAIDFYCEMMVGAVLDGIQEEITSTGGDIGESAEGPVEKLPEEAPGKAPAPAAAADKAETAKEAAVKPAEVKEKAPVPEDKSDDKAKAAAKKPKAKTKDEEPTAAEKPAATKTEKKEKAKDDKTDPPKAANKPAKGKDTDSAKKKDADKDKDTAKKKS